MKLPFILFLSALQVSATTYYVNGALGSDGNPGTAGRPWQSISRVNRATLMPGDQVLFQRGQVWREQLNITWSGNAGAPITFDAYGAGRKPQIAGSDAMTWWIQAGPNTYMTNQGLQTYNVYVDDGDPLLQQGSVSAVTSTPGSWYRDSSGHLYVRLLDNSNPAQHQVEVAVRPFGVYSNQSTYINFFNIEVKQTSQTGIYATSKDGNSPTEYWTIAHCTIRNVREAAVYVLPSGWSGQPMLRGWVLQDNSIGRVDSTPTLNYDSAGLLVRGTTGAIIKGNSIATVNRFGMRVSDYFGATPSASPVIEGNELGMNEGNISIAFTPNAVVTNNLIANSKGFGIGIGGPASTNASITNNVIVNLAISDDQTLYNGLDCNAGSTGGLFAYNTVVAVTNYSMTLEADGGQACLGWTVMNNIFDARANIPHPLANGITGAFYSLAPVSNISLGNNNYLPAPNSPNGVVRYLGVDYGFPAWTTITHEVNAFSVDPQFVNASGGSYTLLPSSPCRMNGSSGGCGRYIH